jgi:hypothetical protein
MNDEISAVSSGRRHVFMKDHQGGTQSPVIRNQPCSNMKRNVCLIAIDGWGALLFLHREH